MELIIIRHGQSYVNLGNWDQLDTMDTALTELGQQQAAALRDWLKEQNPSADALYASTMRRTRETAQYVSEGLGLDPIFDDRIREIGNCYNDGKPVEEDALPRAYNNIRVNEAPFAPTVPDVDNAESRMHFRIRIGQFVHDIYDQHKDQTVYVVAHGGVIAALFDLVFNVGSYKQCATSTDNTGWTRFVYHPNESFSDWMLHDHNRVDHLIKADLLQKS
jgi:2,3-bisphosphoglycerate-dependent phosphoglycerate mutase